MESAQIKTLKKQVEHILSIYPETRNSDAELVTRVCAIFGHDPISKATSIERCRRWFNQRGKYLPTNEQVAKERRMNIYEWKKAMGYRVLQEQNRQEPFHVFRSDTDRNVVYTVKELTTAIICNCPGFHYTGRCKHVEEVKRSKVKANTLGF